MQLSLQFGALRVFLLALWLRWRIVDDILTRLREYEAIADNAYVINALVSAADEIERLRKLVVLCPKCYEAEHGVGRWEQEVRGE